MVSKKVDEVPSSRRCVAYSPRKSYITGTGPRERRHTKVGEHLADLLHTHTHTHTMHRLIVVMPPYVCLDLHDPLSTVPFNPWDMIMLPLARGKLALHVIYAAGMTWHELSPLSLPLPFHFFRHPFPVHGSNSPEENTSRFRLFRDCHRIDALFPSQGGCSRGIRLINSVTTSGWVY